MVIVILTYFVISNLMFHLTFMTYNRSCPKWVFAGDQWSVVTALTTNNDQIILKKLNRDKLVLVKKTCTHKVKPKATDPSLSVVRTADLNVHMIGYNWLNSSDNLLSYLPYSLYSSDIVYLVLEVYLIYPSKTGVSVIFAIILAAYWYWIHYSVTYMQYQTTSNINKNLAIANRSRVSCINTNNNTSYIEILLLFPWNLV